MERKNEELRIDWAIANAKGVICLRRYRECREERWLELADRHFLAANGLLAEIDRLRSAIGDPVEYVGAERVSG